MLVLQTVDGMRRLENRLTGYGLDNRLLDGIFGLFGSASVGELLNLLYGFLSTDSGSIQKEQGWQR